MQKWLYLLEQFSTCGGVGLYVVGLSKVSLPQRKSPYHVLI